jgi:hypothetical protein
LRGDLEAIVVPPERDRAIAARELAVDRQRFALDRQLPAGDDDRGKAAVFLESIRRQHLRDELAVRKSCDAAGRVATKALP